MSGDWRSDPITDKQNAVIVNIQANTKHQFRGKTKGEACDFIDAYIDESRSNTREIWQRINEEEARHGTPFGLERNEYGRWV